ncbi:MAG: SulP family inorganic anion transporter [Proteobacteria bacterium]|nr:SulP family inorganic anion transporter [Pseudomonadota bacterium]
MTVSPRAAKSRGLVRAMGRRLLSFGPHLRGAGRDTLAPDALAGITTAVLALPQGLAYALVAGLPPAMGLLAAGLPCLVAALFGASRGLVTGPTNPTALLIGATVVAPAIAAGGDAALGTVLMVGALAGLVLVGFALLGLGGAARFLADPVVVGFTSGAGLLIALGQVPTSLGVVIDPVDVNWPPVAAALDHARQAVLACDPRALAVAAVVPVWMWGLRRIDPRIPGALLSLAFATGLAYSAGWTVGPEALVRLGELERVWPTWSFSAADPRPLAPAALALALLISVQSIAAARAFGRRGGSEGASADPDRELFSQGVANLVAAGVGAMPVSGSLTRSAVAVSSGARSRVAAALAGLCVLFLVPSLGSLLANLPLAAVSGLVIFTGLDLVSRKALRRASLTSGDAAVLWGTFATTLALGLMEAVYVGIFLSLLLLIRRAGKLRLSELVHVGSESLREIPLDDQTGRTPVVVLNLEGDLSFAVAPALSDAIAMLGQRQPKVVVLRLKRVQHLDATALEVFRRGATRLHADGVRLILCGITATQQEALQGSELMRVLDQADVLPEGDRLAEGLLRAIRAARSSLPQLSPGEIFRHASGKGRGGAQ